ncbi:MAG: DUF4199 domain-containing protein [Bacteroidia bacterium]|jgi:hypothetical protein|nr:DUF4199 domain-containing protein [Bacteroidia bacterium]
MIKLYKPSIDQGVRMGIITIVIFLGIYAFDPLYFAKPTGWITALVVNLLALPIVFMILGAKNTKVNFTPYTFGNAFNAAFFTGVVSSLIVLGFNAIFMTLIDSTWEQSIFEETMNTTESLMTDMGASQDDIDEAMEKANEAYADQPKGLVGAMMNTGKGLVWYAILALIIGAVQKDKKTEEELV